MNNKTKILVSGCGGDIGQSIGKILQKSDDKYSLFGIDISDRNAGKFIFNNFSIGLPVSNSGYFEFLSNYLRQNKIDLYIPIAEPELRFFSEKGITDKIEYTKMLTANIKTLQIGFDKYATSQFLKESDLPYPKTLNGSEQIKNILSYPFILKSRTGSGSKDIYIVENDFDYNYLSQKINSSDFVIQEFIPDTDGEYTCGLFRSNSGEIRTITFRRELTGGYSRYGEIINNDNIDSLLRKIAVNLDLKGSINVQLRIKDDEPIVFEINPRFSSTVLFRDLFGFNDLEWSIQDALNIPLKEYNPSIEYSCFYKGFSEYID